MPYNLIDGVIYAKTEGKVDFKYMKSKVEALIKEDSLPDNLRILEEAKGVWADFSQTEIEELTVLMNKMATRFKSIRHAVVHDMPLNTAITMLMADLVSGTSYQLSPFSTVEAAKNWLKKK